MNWAAFWGAFTGIMIGPTPLLVFFVLSERKEQREHYKRMEKLNGRV